MKATTPPTEREQLKARIAYLEARLVRTSTERSELILEHQAQALEQIGCELYDKFGLTPDQIDYIAARVDELRQQAKERGRP